MIGLDTNVLVRFLVQDDVRQSTRARELIQSAIDAGDELFLNHIVLCETVWVLESAYKFKRARIADTLEKLLLAEHVVVERKDEVRTVLAAYRAGKADFADHIIAAVNVRNGCDETVTFDTELRGTPSFRVL
jgi:predicted nucleic-acid-binding protein